jgi:hypothetical protein
VGTLKREENVFHIPEEAEGEFVRSCTPDITATTNSGVAAPEFVRSCNPDNTCHII